MLVVGAVRGQIDSRVRRDLRAGYLVVFAAGFGGLIMMWAPAVPGNMIHGPPGIGMVESPVLCAVAYGQ